MRFDSEARLADRIGKVVIMTFDAGQDAMAGVQQCPQTLDFVAHALCSAASAVEPNAAFPDIAWVVLVASGGPSH